MNNINHSKYILMPMIGNEPDLSLSGIKQDFASSFKQSLSNFDMISAFKETTDFVQKIIGVDLVKNWLSGGKNEHNAILNLVNDLEANNNPGLESTPAPSASRSFSPSMKR